MALQKCRQCGLLKDQDSAYRDYRYVKKTGEVKKQTVCKDCEKLNARFKRLASKEELNDKEEALYEKLLDWYKQIAANAGGHENINMPKIARELCFGPPVDAEEFDYDDIISKAYLAAANLQTLLDNYKDDPASLISYLENIDESELTDEVKERLNDIDDALYDCCAAADNDEIVELYQELQAVILDIC